MASDYRLELFNHPAQLDVVGEASFVDSLKEAHYRTGGGLVVAVLIPEPENPHDMNAIRVVLVHDGVNMMAGYLPRASAAELAPLINDWVKHGALPVVGASIHPFDSDDRGRLFHVRIGGTPPLRPGATFRAGTTSTARPGIRGPLVYIGVPIVILIALIAILTGNR